MQILFKTELCRHFLADKCGLGDSCRYAHSLQDLRAKPDLRFTSLCYSVVKGEKCTRGPDCSYAHSLDELKSARSRASTRMEGGEGGLSSPSSGSPPAADPPPSRPLMQTQQQQQQPQMPPVSAVSAVSSVCGGVEDQQKQQRHHQYLQQQQQQQTVMQTPASQQPYSTTGQHHQRPTNTNRAQTVAANGAYPHPHPPPPPSRPPPRPRDFITGRPPERSTRLPPPPPLQTFPSFPSPPSSAPRPHNPVVPQRENREIRVRSTNPFSDSFHTSSTDLHSPPPVSYPSPPPHRQSPSLLDPPTERRERAEDPCGRGTGMRPFDPTARLSSLWEDGRDPHGTATHAASPFPTPPHSAPPALPFNDPFAQGGQQQMWGQGGAREGADCMVAGLASPRIALHSAGERERRMMERQQQEEERKVIGVGMQKENGDRELMTENVCIQANKALQTQQSVSSSFQEEDNAAAALLSEWWQSDGLEGQVEVSPGDGGRPLFLPHKDEAGLGGQGAEGDNRWETYTTQPHTPADPENVTAPPRQQQKSSSPLPVYPLHPISSPETRISLREKETRKENRGGERHTDDPRLSFFRACTEEARMGGDKEEAFAPPFRKINRARTESGSIGGVLRGTPPLFPPPQSVPLRIPSQSRPLSRHAHEGPRLSSTSTSCSSSASAARRAESLHEGQVLCLPREKHIVTPPVSHSPSLTLTGQCAAACCVGGMEEEEDEIGELGQQQVEGEGEGEAEPLPLWFLQCSNEPGEKISSIPTPSALCRETKIAPASSGDNQETGGSAQGTSFFFQ
uniref:C3H1-type domain-containing protein n=1 Tax=Chromera velia CCMP2878 TaxID=1169474 RepID=A0A0G4I2T2_9ALVE|eukprot:Cvel_10494.t1-p1 / transcript=Cvel_10494.t1 / gene=Cvel_10494 / organism=Chromera_velia_CCMP2878 / gene_product=hypothetical protein / transcript_product=hypothetical protein / location=Cvel_scaffold634:31780-35802(+) / protein_length=793 / sequence_SO=supercontig / SO=protein_coding / is_pseudo=false